MREKRDMMRLHIKNGITNLDDIRSSYNEFKEGGNIYGRKTTTSNQMQLSPMRPAEQQMDYSFVPGKYKVPGLSEQELRKRVWAQDVEKSRIRQANNTTSEFINGRPNPNAKLGLEIVSPEFALMTGGVGSLGNMATTTAGKIGAAALHGAGQGAMANMANISGSKQNLEGLAADVLGGAVIGGGLKGIGLSAKPTAKYALEKAEPYLMGNKQIPMTGYKPKQEFWNPFSKEVKSSVDSHLQGNDAIKMFQEYGGENLNNAGDIGVQIRAYVPEARRIYGLENNLNITDNQIAEALYKQAKTISNDNSPKIGFKVGYDNGSTILSKSANPIEHLFEAKDPGWIDNTYGVFTLNDITNTPGVSLYGRDVAVSKLPGYKNTDWSGVHHVEGSIPVRKVGGLTLVDGQKIDALIQRKTPGQKIITDIPGFTTFDYGNVRPENAKAFKLFEEKSKTLGDSYAGKHMQFGEFGIDPNRTLLEYGKDYARAYDDILNIQNNVDRIDLPKNYTKPINGGLPIKSEYPNSEYQIFTNKGLKDVKHLLPYDMRVKRDWKNPNIYKSVIPTVGIGYGLYNQNK